MQSHSVENIGVSKQRFIQCSFIFNNNCFGQYLALSLYNSPQFILYLILIMGRLRFFMYFRSLNKILYEAGIKLMSLFSVVLG